jgi:hypothetical protein
MFWYCNTLSHPACLELCVAGNRSIYEATSFLFNYVTTYEGGHLRFKTEPDAAGL